MERGRGTSSKGTRCQTKGKDWKLDESGCDVGNAESWQGWQGGNLGVDVRPFCCAMGQYW